MRLERLSAIGLLIAIAVSGNTAADAELPPAEHPIHAKPEVLDQYMADVRAYEIVYSNGPPKPLEWRLTLDRERYVVGEPIAGLLKVTNPAANRREDATFAYRFSPPHNGHYVSTISTWRSIRRGEVWGPLEEAFEDVNRGKVRVPAGIQGNPVELAPGESRKFPVLLNVAWGNWGHWCSGLGFSEPGRYRAFVRYHNFEPQFPFASRSICTRGGTVLNNGICVRNPLGTSSNNSRYSSVSMSVTRL